MENRMEQLREECLQCQKCPLAATRHHVVFGTGKTDAEVVFVGEGPGENEDLQGEPFVGRGGALLDKYLEAVDLSRERNIYIANIVKCRPPQNRDPKPEETACCIGYLSRQLEIIKPKIIVCLGRVAATILIDKGFKVTRTANGLTKTASGIWAPSTRRRCCAIRTTSRMPLRICSPCRAKSGRSAPTPTTEPNYKKSLLS